MAARRSALLALLVLPAAIVALASPDPVSAQQTAGGGAPTASALPLHPGAWINSAPLSAKALEGKAALLYFYEEGCPRCRERWPQLQQTARQFEGKPIVFIAVNSGNPRPAVEQYVRQVRLQWPVIVDPTREFERAAGVGEVSLQNIYQVALIRPDGSIVRGSAADIEGSANQALQGAAWKVDPAGIPAQLKPAWLAIEMGDYAGAAAIIKKNKSSPRSEIKEGVERLTAGVDKLISELADEGAQAVQSGDKWLAYKKYAQLHEQFGGFDLPEGAEEARKELSADPQVKQTLAAAQQVAAAQKMAAGGTASARRRATTILEKVIQDVPGSEPAAEAQRLLDQLR